MLQVLKQLLYSYTNMNFHAPNSSHVLPFVTTIPCYNLYPISNSGWILENISSLKELLCNGTAAQGGDGVTIPGGVPEHLDVALREEVSGHGGDGLAAGLHDLSGLFQL